jgi:hypothetical protein
MAQADAIASISNSQAESNMPPMMTVNAGARSLKISLRTTLFSALNRRSERKSSSLQSIQRIKSPDFCKASRPFPTRWQRLRLLSHSRRVPRRSRPRLSNSFPADLASRETLAWRISRNRQRREPRPRSVEGYSPCGRFLRARSNRAGPDEPRGTAEAAKPRRQKRS